MTIRLLARCASACIAALALHATPAVADSYPSKPIRLIVPFAPGGVTDVGARIVADQLGQRIGRQIVVDNRPGAGGNIGAQQVAGAAPDGYTLLLGFDGTMVINPHVYEKVPFDTLNDFVPVSKIGDAALIIVTNPQVPVKTMQELIDYAKTQPEGVSFGSAGIGSTPHLAGELLRQRTGADFVHVPYKGGGQAIADVVGGTLPMLYTSVASAYPFVQKGQVQGVAVSSGKRLASLPDVPTVSETVPDFELNSWIGIFAPAGTSPEVVDYLQRELNAVVHTPAVRERLANLGIEASGNTPAVFREQVAQDLAKYERIVKDANISLN